MKYIGIFLVLLVSINSFSPNPTALNSKSMALDLKSIAVTPYGSNQLKLDFNCVGGSGLYNYQFNDLPVSWQAQGGSLYLPRTDLDTSPSRRIVVQVRDSTGARIEETLTLSFTNTNFEARPVRVSAQGINYASNLMTSTQNSNTAIGIDYLLNGYPGIEGISSQPSVNLLLNQNNGGNTPQTREQIQLSSSLNRQNTANMAVKNLLLAIQRITNAINSEKQQLIVLEQQLKIDKQNTASCQTNFYTTQDTRKKIQNAISDKTNALDQLLGEIKRLEIDLNDRKMRKRRAAEEVQALQSQALPSSSSLTRIQTQLQRCNRDNDAANREISEAQIKVTTNQNMIKMKEIGITESTKLTATLKNSLLAIKMKIQQIQLQLTRAQEQESKIQAQLSNEQKIPELNTIQIKKLQQQNKNLQTTISNKNSSITDCGIFSRQINAIQQIVQQDKQKYDQLVKQSNKLSQEIVELERTITDLKKQSSTIPNQLYTLSNELDKYVASLRRIAYLCQDAQFKERRTVETIQAVANQFSSDSERLNTAKRDLERARAEEQLANQAVDELIASTVESSNLYPTNDPLIINLRDGITSGRPPIGTQASAQNIVTQQNTVAVNTINQQNQGQISTSQQPSITNSGVNIGETVYQQGSSSGNFVVQNGFTYPGVIKTDTTSTSGNQVIGGGITQSGGANISGNQVLETQAKPDGGFSINTIFTQEIPQQQTTTITAGTANTGGNKIITNTNSQGGFTLNSLTQTTQTSQTTSSGNNAGTGFTLDSIINNNGTVTSGNISTSGNTVLNGSVSSSGAQTGFTLDSILNNGTQKNPAATIENNATDTNNTQTGFTLDSITTEKNTTQAISIANETIEIPPLQENTVPIFSPELIPDLGTVPIAENSDQLTEGPIPIDNMTEVPVAASEVVTEPITESIPNQPVPVEVTVPAVEPTQPSQPIQPTQPVQVTQPVQQTVSQLPTQFTSTIKVQRPSTTDQTPSPIQPQNTVASSIEALPQGFEVSSNTSEVLQLPDIAGFFADTFGVQFGSSRIRRAGQLYTIDPEVKRQINDAIIMPQNPSDTFLCNNSEVTEFHTGTITERSEQSIDIEDPEGAKYRIVISKCTKIASLSSSDQLVPGTAVFFSGDFLFQFAGSKLFNALQLISFKGTS